MTTAILLAGTRTIAQAYAGQRKWKSTPSGWKRPDGTMVRFAPENDQICGLPRGTEVYFAHEAFKAATFKEVSAMVDCGLWKWGT